MGCPWKSLRSCTLFYSEWQQPSQGCWPDCPHSYLSDSRMQRQMPLSRGLDTPSTAGNRQSLSYSETIVSWTWQGMRVSVGGERKHCSNSSWNTQQRRLGSIQLSPQGSAIRSFTCLHNPSTLALWGEGKHSAKFKHSREKPERCRLSANATQSFYLCATSK